MRLWVECETAAGAERALRAWTTSPTSSGSTPTATSVNIRSDRRWSVKHHTAMINQASETRQLLASLRPSYDYVVIGAGAAGCVLASELSGAGAQVLLIESGGTDDAPTVLNPSLWFYNVGGPLDYHLPITPLPQLNNRNFNMALGHVLGGGSSINAMVWIRGTQSDYDGWAENGAKGWAFADVLPASKSQEDWEVA